MQKTTEDSRGKKKHLNPQPFASIRKTERKREDGGGEEKMKGYSYAGRAWIGGRGKRRKNKREDSWVITAVHHFRVAVNGRQPLLC